jgi:PAS domain S-box-containing protein
MPGRTPTDPFPAPLADDRQYRLLVEAVTDYAIYMIDPDGIVASWNAGAERFKGYTAAEIIGHNFDVFYTLEDQANGEPKRALQVAATAGRFESEGWRVRKNGSRFWASVVVDPIRDGGRLIGFAKVTRDISERKDAEQALVQANAALAQAQKMEALGQLTGGIAHDFNNLLAAVIGSLELLRKRLPAEPNTKRLLDNAVHGARRGTSLTQRMLAFARRQDLAPEPIDLPDLVRGMTSFLEPALGPTVTLELNLPRTLNPVVADFNQLEMALLNLAVNARDAMQNRGTITISLREDRLAHGQIHALEAGSYACLSVEDSGTGMNAATLARAMEPFYSTKGPGQGTGLGLSMVHGMALQANGALVLKSEPGHGTTAELWFPLSKAGSRKGGRALPAQAPRSAAPSVVLAVDDDALVRLTVAMMLEDLGHKVFEAGSGKEALALLASEPSIALVVTEMAMPQMTGIQLFIEARRLYPALKFLLASGYAEASEDDQPQLPRITKPFWQEDLAQAIDLILAGAPPTRGVIPFPQRFAP